MAATQPPTRRRGEAATAFPPAQGLCALCRRAADCTFSPRLEGRAVRACDEFDGAAGRPGARAVAPLPGEDAESGGGRPRLGLCANCDAWRGCTYPKPDSGVWSCDEYE